MLKNEIANLKTKALQNKKRHSKLLLQLKKLKPFDVDELFHTQHEQVFKEIDCLHCGNCCKTTPPLLINEDIKRISKHLKLSTKFFLEKYVVKDEDGDLVFNQTPCIFLGKDDYCSIYEARPKACREYPHTNRKKMNAILELTIKNAEICPAVARILDTLDQNS